MAIGRIISVGKKDFFYLHKEDLIGKKVEFSLAETEHKGGGYREGVFYTTRKIYFRKTEEYLDKGQMFYFVRVKVRIVKKGD